MKKHIMVIVALLGLWFNSAANAGTELDLLIESKLAAEVNAGDATSALKWAEVLQIYRAAEATKVAAALGSASAELVKNLPGIARVIAPLIERENPALAKAVVSVLEGNIAGIGEAVSIQVAAEKAEAIEARKMASAAKLLREAGPSVPAIVLSEAKKALPAEKASKWSAEQELRDAIRAVEGNLRPSFQGGKAASLR